MSDRFFNRDRNRPYDDDFDEEFADRDYRSHGRFQRDEEYDDYGAGYSGQGFDREQGRGQRRSGYGQDFESRQQASYDQMYGRGRQYYGYETDYDRWNRSEYGPYGRSGRGQGEYNQQRYGQGSRRGQNQERQSGYGTTSGYGQDYGRRFNYDYDFDASPTSWTYTEIWLIPGPFTGVGPEDYQRSDERIREDVNERLTQHGRLNARSIKVEVKDGEVTLTGTVDHRQAKRMAEEVADSVTGVKDIHNQLRIQEQQGNEQQQAQREGDRNRH